MILEEAAYIDRSMFYDVVAPLMLVEKTAVMAISSPSDEFNYYSMLLNLKKTDGSPLFKQIRLGLACQSCIDKGEGAACTHMQHIIPSWLSVGRSEQARLLYQADQASFEREVQGRIASDERYAFNKQHLQLFSLRPRHIYESTDRVRTIHVGIDPHGGGKLSDFVMISLNWQQGKKVILGMETSDATRDIEVICLMKSHLAKLKRIYPRSVIFLYIEANMSYISADRMAVSAKEVSSDIRIVSKDRTPANRPGVTTGELEKRLYKDAISESLSSEALVYARDFICETDEKKISNQMKLEEQLQMFREIIIPSSDNNVRHRAKLEYSGQGKDDTVMALGIALYFGRTTREDPDYIKESREQGWDAY